MIRCPGLNQKHSLLLLCVVLRTFKQVRRATCAHQERERAPVRQGRRHELSPNSSSIRKTQTPHSPSRGKFDSTTKSGGLFRELTPDEATLVISIDSNANERPWQSVTEEQSAVQNNMDFDRSADAPSSVRQLKTCASTTTGAAHICMSNRMEKQAA